MAREDWMKHQIFRFPDHLIKLLEHYSKLIGETKSEFVRKAILLRIQYVKELRKLK